MMQVGKARKVQVIARRMPAKIIANPIEIVTDLAGQRTWENGKITLMNRVLRQMSVRNAAAEVCSIKRKRIFRFV